jgi:hypothetical protein
VKFEASIHAPFPSAMSSCADIAYWFAFFFVFSQIQQFSFSFQQLALKNVVAAVLQLFFLLRQNKGKKKKPTVTPPPCLMGIIRDA